MEVLVRDFVSHGIAEADARRLGRALASSYEEVWNDPRFRDSPERAARIASATTPEDGYFIGQAFGLAAGGSAHRLSDLGLDQWNDMRLTLAEIDTELCARMWLGGLDIYLVFRALARLPDDELRAVMNVAAEASMRRLDAEITPPPPDQEVLDAGFEWIIGRLGPISGQRFERGLEAGAAANAEEACFMVSAIHREIRHYPQPGRAAFLRQLLIP